MQILVLGANGQLGRSLRDTQPDDQQVTFATRSEVDLSQAGEVTNFLGQLHPDLVINAAAYTAVDKAEEEPEMADQINGSTVGEIAAWAANNNARLIHISTDFVFDGAGTRPYLPGDETGPISAYGESKLKGEMLALGSSPEQTMIIRTAWVYSEHGSNFVKTMLRLMKERDELGVVADQVGSPTYARGLAEVIWLIVSEEKFTPGIFHWSDNGHISWHEFAEAIQQEGLQSGLLEQLITVNAITTEEFPTPAARPAFSVLDTSKLGTALGIEPEPWTDNLKRMMGQLSG